MIIEIKNARITSTTLGPEDHGIMTANLNLDYGGSMQGFGGYSLDVYDDKLKKRVPHIALAQFITRVMEVVGVEKWEDLKGKVLRVKGEHGNIHAIGHYLEDKWFNPAEELRDD